MRHGLAAWLATGLILAWGQATGTRADEGAPAAAIHETFDDLEAWEPLHFPKIPRHTRFRPEREDGNSVLRVDADASASAIVHTERFAVRRFPNIRWRWKIDRVLEKGDAATKAGDDYPIRVYVIFEYDPEQADLGDRIRYGAAKVLYGRYPPHSSLNYIWANRPHPQEILVNPYTDRARMLPLQTGNANAGRWMKEARNILEDYRRAFGTEPPEMATVAIMADTDNTGEQATARVDDLAVSP